MDSRAPMYDSWTPAPTILCPHGIAFSESCAPCGRYIGITPPYPPTFCPACAPHYFPGSPGDTTGCSCRCHWITTTAGVGSLH